MTPEHEHTDPQCVIRRRGAAAERFCNVCDPVRMAQLSAWTLPELRDSTAGVAFEADNLVTMLGLREITWAGATGLR